MEAKYYTPTIEEFHVGFEFERKSTLRKNSWVKKFFADGESAEQYCYDEEGRVKLLDREYIEAEGFEFSENYADRPTLGFLKEFKDSKDLQYLLFYTPETNELRIERIFQCGTGKEDYLFNGFVRNRSELKKIMQMLNIK